ncbi:hypothetical protein [Kribbella sp. VKM Ac-2566]|uniref:hypothetical protein n=1 Tax=Kribbella sp. VKM Ac-2566 TaxID=2512218 RepID=UPI001063DC7B|nr:hypothetical protein [Kribbella sp. VKM Ac-2566]TDX03538.1 hypothetical protein EV647_1779 [Kribbella sp. VKM Ac-2566]
MDFDRLFDPGYSAIDLFTNRSAENLSFTQALTTHAERVFDGSARLDAVERRNVLTFYGIGGIGKTELSHRLEAWVRGELADPGDWGEAPRFDQEVSAVRVDFHGSAVVDAVDIVLRLRTVLGGAGRRFPAFDLGLAAWWALARPGSELPELRTRNGFDIRGQIGDTVNDLLGDLVVGLGVGAFGVRLAARAVEAIRTRRLTDRTLGDCEPLVTLIEKARTDPSPYVAATLAGLLSWDLDRLAMPQRPLVVAFADAIEYVQDDNRVQERLFNRVVHLTPAVLWVITSRNSLDWDSSELNRLLPASGPRVWPGLRLDAWGEPRQHLVGDLSDADVDRYLTTASGMAGNPRLSPDVIARVRAGAHGLPLYLDLSLTMARVAAADGDGELAPEAFGGPLPELVGLVFSDLPEDEREVARTASLLPRFSPELVARASGRLVGAARRFCRRTMVSHDGHTLFPFRLHDAVRSAIAGEPITMRGAWAEADRRDRAQGLVDALQQEFTAAVDSVSWQRDILELTAGLCATHDLQTPWLLDALVDVPGMALTAERMPAADPASWIGQVSRFLDCYRQPDTPRRMAALESFIAEPLRDDVSVMASRFLAYALRSAATATQSQRGQALAILQRQLAAEPDSQLLRYQVARTLNYLEDFEQLSTHLSRYPMTDPAAELRMRSDLAYRNGRLAEAIAGASARAEYLRSVGRHRVALENQVVVLWRSALLGRTTAADCDPAIAATDRYGMRSPMRTAMAAKSLCLADDESSVRQFLADGAALSQFRGGKPGWREWSVSLIHALRRGAYRSVQDIRGEWVADPRPPTYDYRVIDRIFVYAGYPATYDPPQLGGSDGVAASYARWHQVIDDLVHGRRLGT